jgi:HEAT repeat protein
MGIFKSMFKADINKLKAGNKTKKLFRMLQSTDSVTRGDAAKALGEICPDAARKSLIALLNDDNQYPAKIAFKALIKNNLANNDEVYNALRLTRQENIEEFLYYLGDDAARVIRYSGAPVPLNTLIRVCSHGKFEYIEEWLLSDKDAALEALLDDLKTPRNRNHLSYSPPLHTINILGKLNDKRAVPGLIKALKNEDEEVKHDAAEVLGMLGDQSAVEPLKLLLKKKDESLVKIAYKALKMLGWEPDDGLEMMQLAILNEDADVFAKMDSEQIDYLTQIVLGQSFTNRGFAAKLLGTKDLHLLRKAWEWDKKVMGASGKRKNEGPEKELLYEVLMDIESDSKYRLFIVTGLRWLPEIPSIVEALIPGLVTFTWSGALGREGVVKEIVRIAPEIKASSENKYLVWGPGSEYLAILLDADDYPQNLIKTYYGKM